MSTLVIDTETTIIQNGNPFHPDNKLCLVGMLDEESACNIEKVEYDDEPYGSSLSLVDDCINASSLIVGFNIKFDYHWLRRYGISRFQEKRTWDCQVVAFILSGQQWVMPSLNDVALHYGLGQKIDIVERDYWSKGIDTPQIPYDCLYEYLKQDLVLTSQIYEKQRQELYRASQATRTLCSIANQDLIVLEEMEWNGVKYDFEQAKVRSREVETRIEEITGELSSLVASSLESNQELSINWASGDFLSVVLYGGTLRQDGHEPNGTFKTGSRQGQPRFKIVKREFHFPQLVKPDPRSALKKEGFYSTAEDVLKNVRNKANKRGQKIIDLLMERSYLEKLNGTYLVGLENLYMDCKGENGILHGQFNQSVARTGRLSSSKPNLQNMSSNIKSLFVSRYV